MIIVIAPGPSGPGNIHPPPGASGTAAVARPPPGARRAKCPGGLPPEAVAPAAAPEPGGSHPGVAAGAGIGAPAAMPEEAAMPARRAAGTVGPPTPLDGAGAPTPLNGAGAPTPPDALRGIGVALRATGIVAAVNGWIAGGAVMAGPTAARGAGPTAARAAGPTAAGAADVPIAADDDGEPTPARGCGCDSRINVLSGSSSGTEAGAASNNISVLSSGSRGGGFTASSPSTNRISVRSGFSSCCGPPTPEDGFAPLSVRSIVVHHRRRGLASKASDRCRTECMALRT